MLQFKCTIHGFAVDVNEINAKKAVVARDGSIGETILFVIGGGG